MASVALTADGQAVASAKLGTAPRHLLAYRPDIDGLRAVAVISVVAFHARVAGFRGGFVGVDVFFVISGYLIGSLVYNDLRGDRFSIVDFYARRARRILPALFTVLLVSYVLACLLLTPLEMSAFARSARATVASCSNVYFYRAVDYFTPDSALNPLLMGWSLGVEEQFYMVLPLLLVLLRRAPWIVQLCVVGFVSVLSLFFAAWTLPHAPLASFFLLPARAWELGAGVLLAICHAGNRRSTRRPRAVAHLLSLAGAATIGWAVECFDRSTAFPGCAALLPVTGAVLMIAAEDGIVNRVLCWRPFVLVGLVSYSWYLWHWPLLSFARICADAELSDTASVAICLAALGLAVLSYRYVERPLRASGAPSGFMLARYAAAGCLLMLLAQYFYRSDGLPQRYPAARRIEAFRRVSFDPCLAVFASHPVFSPGCVPSGPGPALALLGDSHAAALAIALRPIAARSGYRLIEMARGSCPVLQGVTLLDTQEPGGQQRCTQFNHDRIEFVLRDPSVQVVVLESYWSAAFGDDRHRFRLASEGQDALTTSSTEGDRLLASGLNALLLRLEEAHKVVYLIEDDATLPFDPLKSLCTRHMKARRLVSRVLATSFTGGEGNVTSIPDPAPDRRVRGLLHQVTASHSDLHVFDLEAALCSASQCRIAEQDQPLYEDRTHLSELGARIALSGFELPPPKR